MTHYKFGSEIKNKSIPKNVKVAIVGAGMSGLYSAWRLENESNINDFAIFERSDRTGGRLDSDLINFKNQKSGPNQPSTITVKEEQGGMRFLFDGMDDLMALFLKLDLQDQIVPFPMNSGGNNRLYFRGAGFSVSEAADDEYAIWSALYNLDPAERGMNPTEIVNVVFNRILQVNPHFSERPKVKGPEFWQKFRLDCQWNGKPLNEWTLWDLYSDMGYSQECITMLYRALGFNGTFLSKMNAGVAYQLLEDFPADAKFRTFKDGFSTLPNALVDKVGTERIHLQTEIEAIDYDEECKEYILRYTHIDEHDQEHRGHIRAEKVILGLPRLALERLFIGSNAFHRLPKPESQKIWNTLQTATNQPLLKINLYYDTAWWATGITGRPSVEFGPNFADLPTGSVYPFYAVNDTLAAALMYEERRTNPSKETQAKLDEINAEKYERPAALTIYCDYLNINFWSALQDKGELFHNPNQDRYVQSVPSDIYPASVAVVEQATAFFKKIFDTHYVPEPVLTSARIWEGSVDFDLPQSQQFGYGVHQWAVGADDRAVMKELTEPLPNLFTCGEAFSDYQGWVEGALRSTDLVLQKGFGLAPLSEVYEQQTGVPPSIAITAVYEENASKLIHEYIDPQLSLSDAPIDHTCDKRSVLGVNLTYFDKI
ncbi:FAD-dependent L-amino acid oxidase [Pseudoalteromonas sp. MMG022]|uniref:FAD-dependent L-amino acid oxidase n=1 Tax=Pseudoalteromonas sp. MMG022 TaxID=2909978 RepID=UPI001EEE6260|nr:FAD-dependent L-amino acid oxidase [Pseudoalteromonas sp. MMG022]MCF6437586.1 FAD-dependent L-amino acid oxidase [Pseudoalteromonas sp. MMG022]